MDVCALIGNNGFAPVFALYERRNVMWIWIGVGMLYWLICFILVQKMMRNIRTNKWPSLAWDSGDTSTAIFLGVFGIIAVPMIFLMDGKNCFKKSTKIYWDEKQQQIKTKSGKCLVDVNRIEKLIATQGAAIGKLGSTLYKKTLYDRNLDRILELQGKVKLIEKVMANTKSEIATTYQAQLQCQAKGHGKWVFVKKINRGSEPVWILLPSDGYAFKCSNCGLEITKTAKELTTTEREALKKLKLL